MTQPSLDGCVTTFAGFETGFGYVEEIVCGETPDATDEIEKLKYYDDDGIYRFRPFGHLISGDAMMNDNKVSVKGIGSRTIACVRHGKYVTTGSATYHPINTRRLYYTLGIVDGDGDPVYDVSELTGPVCIGDCLPSFSVLKWYDSECTDDGSIFFLYNMGKVKSFTVSANMDGFIEWSEEWLFQYEQYSSSLSFTEPLQTVVVGNIPILPCCDAFMFWEGDIWKTVYTSENVSSQIVADDTTDIVVTYPIMDFNRDGTVDGNASAILPNQNDCYYDVRVKVNGSYVTISSVDSSDTRYITLAVGVDIGDVVLVEYNYMQQMFHVTSYEFTIDHDTVASGGIYRGLAVPYEIREKTLNLSGSMTTNFRNISEYRQYIQDQWFHLFIQQGGQVVFQLLLCKWNGDYGIPLSEEDLIQNSLSFMFSWVCVDSELREEGINDTEEEGSSSEEEHLYPVV